MIKISKAFTLTVTATSILLSSFASSAEARRAARPQTGALSSVDVNYSFSVYDTDPADEPISCTVFGKGCLFKDAVSDFEITFLRFGDFSPNSINSAEVGTSALNLYGPELPPSASANGVLTDFPIGFSETLSIQSEPLVVPIPATGFPFSIAQYTLTDSSGEAIQAKASGLIDDFETQFPQRFSFSLYSDGSVDNVIPDDGFIDSIDLIVGSLRGDTALPEGYYWGDTDDEDPLLVENVDDDIVTKVPEPSSILGIAVLGTLGMYFKKRKEAQGS